MPDPTISLAPNRFLPLDVAIVAGGTVDGRVVQEVGGRRSGVGGVRLTLRELAGGGRRPLTTFGDGDFSEIALRPGEYEVAVDPAVLHRLGATADPVRFTVHAIPDGDRVTGVELLLVPAAAPATLAASADSLTESVFAAAPVLPDTMTATLAPRPALGGVDGKGSGTPHVRPAVPRVLPTLQTRETRELAQTGSAAVTRILFDMSSALIRRESERPLHALGALLLANPTMQLVIEGHTDSAGTAAYNQTLSERRARAVRWYLHTNYGISYGRMTAIGFGAQVPVADNGSAVGRRLNRRVQFLDAGDVVGGGTLRQALRD